jgi:hypothetical protein
MIGRRAPGADRRSGRTFRACVGLCRREGPAHGKARRFAAAHARRHARLVSCGRRRDGLARILAGHARCAGAEAIRSLTIAGNLQRLQGLAALLRLSGLSRLAGLSDATPYKRFHGGASGDALRPRLLIASHPGGELGILTAHAVIHGRLQGRAPQPFGARVVPAAGDDRLVRGSRPRRGASRWGCLAGGRRSRRRSGGRSFLASGRRGRLTGGRRGARLWIFGLSHGLPAHQSDRQESGKNDRLQHRSLLFCGP